MGAPAVMQKKGWHNIVIRKEGLYLRVSNKESRHCFCVFQSIWAANGMNFLHFRDFHLEASCLAYEKAEMNR